jgi:hypothetical protein
LREEERVVNVGIVTLEDGTTAIRLVIGDVQIIMPPDQAAHLAGTISSSVAAVWGLKIWESQLAALPLSNLTSEIHIVK